MVKIIRNLLFFLFIYAFMFQVVAQYISPAEDKTILNQIREEIVNNGSLPINNIAITVNNGIVELSGTLESDNQVSELIIITQSTDGVKNVITDELNVRNSEQPITDTIITAKIKGLYLQHKLFGDTLTPVMSISITTQNGIVYLSGSATAEQEKIAISIAKSVNAVKEVKSTIRVLP